MGAAPRFPILCVGAPPPARCSGCRVRSSAGSARGVARVVHALPGMPARCARTLATLARPKILAHLRHVLLCIRFPAPVCRPQVLIIGSLITRVGVSACVPAWNGAHLLWRG